MIVSSSGNMIVMDSIQKKSQSFDVLSFIFDAIEIIEFWMVFNQIERTMKIDNKNPFQPEFFDLSEQLRTVNKNVSFERDLICFEKHLMMDIGIHIHMERACLEDLRHIEK